MIEIVRPNSMHYQAVREFFHAIDIQRIKNDFYPHEFTDARAKALCAYSGKDEYYIALTGNLVIGYGMLRGWDEGYEIPSLGLCIHPDYQGKGLGLALTAHLIAAANLRNTRQIMLKAKKTNAAATGLYRRLGFTFSDLDQEFLRGLLVLSKS